MVVPPYLLRSIADSPRNPDNIREAARLSLDQTEQYLAHRAKRLAGLVTAAGGDAPRLDADLDGKVMSDWLKKRIHEVTEIRVCALREIGAESREAAADDSKDAPKDDPTPDPEEGAVLRSIYDAKHTEDDTKLPGAILRREADEPVKDKAANETFDNVGHVLGMYKKHFKWNSLDNKGMPVISSVHFGKKYENAFWDPDKMQMVFGDGGEFLNNFTGCIDVIGHKMTHAVTEQTSPLNYVGQSGALNEHVSDVFGIMIKQIVEKEDAEHADWLIGEACIMPDVKGVALRSMKAPGTAYDDPKLGKDPQPDNFADYVPTYEDNGGVHIYSGIPNKAFYLAAKQFGGYSWEKAGQIWWKTMNSDKVKANCTFHQFANLTVVIAKEMYDEDAARLVRSAWDEVGVKEDEGKQDPEDPTPKIPDCNPM